MDPVRTGRLTAEAGDVARWCAIYAEGRTTESGSPFDAADLARRVGRLTAFVARVGSRLVGAATVAAEDPAYAFAHIYIPEPDRRRGAGRALAGEVRRWALAEYRPEIRATVVEGGPGAAFADALGATVLLRLVTVERRLDRPAPPTPTPAGVSLLRWIDHTPAVHLEAAARLRQAVGDAPDATLQFNPGHRTGGWVREWERAAVAAGHQLWVSAAVVQDTLVGFTEVELVGDGDASQHDTAVLASWRGRGIARWLKADMIERLRAARRSGWITSTINAANTPMLAVCAQLGFHEAHRRLLVASRFRPPMSVPSN